MGKIWIQNKLFCCQLDHNIGNQYIFLGEQNVNIESKTLLKEMTKKVKNKTIIS